MDKNVEEFVAELKRQDAICVGVPVPEDCSDDEIEEQLAAFLDKLIAEQELLPQQEKYKSQDVKNK